MNAELGGKTKIICTIGPASGSEEMIGRLIDAGMNVARLNFSYGTHRTHARYIRTIRNITRERELPIAILQDLPGPKLRAGIRQSREVKLKQGENIVLTTRDTPGDEHQLSISLPSLPRDVRLGDDILLDDGAIKLKVEATTDTDIDCRVVIDGVLKPGKGVIFPGAPLPGPFLSQRDLEHLSFGTEHGVDFVALSFVDKADDVAEVREILNQRGVEIPLIAKIERSEAITNFDEILAAADGIMIARGDLGVEVALERIPLIQKEIIRKCNYAGKPVITATQMLESMVHSFSPTRAEVTDVANAIFDGSDAIMLSAETSIGKYPLQATAMMSHVAKEAEQALVYNHMLTERRAALESQVDDAISYDACHTAHQLGAVAIVAFTKSGSTARRVSKYRPKVPILAITPSEVVRQRLALVWGIYPFAVTEPSSVDELFAQGTNLAKETGIAKEGDLVVITAGIPIGVPGTTNLLKVDKIR
jgi:pyruvate kinase